MTNPQLISDYLFGELLYTVEGVFVNAYFPLQYIRFSLITKSQTIDCQVIERPKNPAKKA